MFTQKDLQEIQKKGISIDNINRQIKYFKSGFPSADITLAATPGQGIINLERGEEIHYKDLFMQNGPDFHMTRFIPASGAASRMFKSLFSAMEELEGKNREEQQAFLEANPELRDFFSALPEYPFYEDLKISGEETPADILTQILGESGLDYGSKPKGLLKFHKYGPDERRTSFEEHVLEAASYCTDSKGNLRLHLTVSPAHLDGFQIEASRVIALIEKDLDLNVDLSFSFQKPETDTLAVDLQNEPFRNTNGSLLFRPGGHGALIQNLDALESDIVFISNIDNVSPDRLKDKRVFYKEILGGVLLEIRSRLFYYLKQLKDFEKVEKTSLDSMVNYLHERLGLAIPDGLFEWDASELRQWLIATMHRPIRVCGMVKNAGEPGGGPFYVKSESGEISLQIVESSQIDLDDPEKAAIVKQSTHFNPVDLVCSVRDFEGNKFKLTDYVDYNTGFISEKSMGGKTLKALELPGLWNGAMANWLTLFVEVPVETFTPVKTVFDLNREEHRA